MPKKKGPRFLGKKSRKAAKPASKVRKPRPRTGTLPGLDDARIEELSAAALQYLDAHEEKKTAAEHEKQKKEELLACMREHGLKRYRDVESDLLVEVEEASEKVKVYVGEGPSKTALDDDRPIGEGTMETAPVAEGAE